MHSEQEIPVLVGVGQVLQRLENPLEAAEPLQMMISALVQAGEDSGVPKLLQSADSICVVRGVWDYGDPGREIAHRLGAIPTETVGTPYGGNYAHSCVIDAARKIQAGQHRIVLRRHSQVIVKSQHKRSNRNNNPIQYYRHPYQSTPYDIDISNYYEI